VLTPEEKIDMLRECLEFYSSGEGAFEGDDGDLYELEGEDMNQVPYGTYAREVLEATRI
jgi:hypothetical protein